MSNEREANSSGTEENFDLDLLLSVVETIIPAREADRAMPAASELAEFRDLPSEEAKFLYGPILDRVRAGDEARGSDAFVSLDREARETILRQLESDRPDIVRGAVLQTLIRYYGAEGVAEGLGLEARPPHPGGYSLRETNWALLDPVREMDPIYKSDKRDKRATGPGDES